MSKKPLKKSDLSKAWMRAGKEKVIRLAPEYHLIVSEGTQTEPLYFGEIKKIINSKYRERIVLEVTGAGDNTENLFVKAQNLARRHGTTPYRHVWLVFDKDDFPNEHFDQTVALCEASSSAETTWHAVWSNQCIELWFLLHFGYLQSDLHRSEYWPKLTQHLKDISCGSYYKNRPDLYQVLRPYMEQAIRNAKRLDEANTGKLPSQSTPGTKVYELIEKLHPYL